MRYTLILIISLTLMSLCTSPSSNNTSTILKVFAGNDTTIVGNDTIRYLGNVLETNVSIETHSWYLLSATKKLIIQDQLLTYIVPDSLCTLSFVFQTRTTQNMVQEDTVNVHVIRDTISVNAGADQIVLVNSMTVLYATHTGDMNDNTFWKIGDNPFLPASPETSFVSPKLPTILTCVFKVESIGREEIDTLVINVVSFDSVYVTANAGEDISAIVGSQVKLQGTYKGKDITNTFWKIGTDPFVIAPSDTSFTLPDTVTTILCVFKVLNENSEDLDTVKINVIANTPLKAYAFGDTTVLPGSQLKISGSYVGRVRYLFWKIGEGPFISASPETTITVPNETMSLKCIFKIQDSQLNQAFDTAVVTIANAPTMLQANAGDDLYVSIDSTVQLKGTVHDPANSANTIIKYEWKYGLGLWTDCPGGIGTFTPQIPGIIVCSLRVMAEDSQVATDFCIINVSSTIEMILIPSKNKTFKMGSNSNDLANPVHNVTFTKNFFMSKTEITQKEYVSLLRMNPSSVKSGDLPVSNCNWFDAVYYCNAKSKQEGFDTVYTYSSVWGTIGYMCFMSDVEIDYTKRGYRLPTEAEWEFACRAGTTTQFYWGDVVDERYVWYKNNSSSEPQIVGKKLPNAYGLYDMSGNVREWCNDWFSPYTSEGKIDPKGTQNSLTFYRIIRNGSYDEIIDNSASFIRTHATPRTVSRKTGFRVVRDE